jgi:nucleoside-diphosphate-sugar epimerase
MLAESGCKSTICTGSCWEYGQQSGKVHEDTPLKPLNAFTAAKNALHWVGREIARENGMHFIWTRLFYVYGPGQRDTSLIPYIISCLRNGKKPEIKMPGARNDFVYVGDVARAIAAIVRKSQRTDVYNIGSGGSTSVQKIIEIIYDKFDLPGKYDRLLNLSNSPVVDFWADISRIKSDIGWEPQSSISEGIAKTINFHTDDCK